MQSGSGFTPGSYALSLQNNASSAWLEILNNAGAGKGAFFGLSSNDFELWNYQAGAIEFFTHPTASGGTSRMIIGNDGNVGVGTTAPGNRLEVKDTTDAGTPLLVRGSNSGSGLGVWAQLRVLNEHTSANTITGIALQHYNAASSAKTAASLDASLSTTTNGAEQGFLAVTTMRAGTPTEALRVMPDGKVGIGTSAPAFPLVVSNAGAAGLEFDPATGLMQAYNRNTSAYGPMLLDFSTLSLRGGGTTDVYINSAGDVGVGTTSPNAGSYSGHVVTIESASKENALELSARTDSLADHDVVGSIDFRAGSSTNRRVAQVRSNIEGTSENAAHLYFLTMDAGTLYERAIIKSNGSFELGEGVLSRELFNSAVNRPERRRSPLCGERHAEVPRVFGHGHNSRPGIAQPGGFKRRVKARHRTHR